jgi:hypothetical protein
MKKERAMIEKDYNKAVTAFEEQWKDKLEEAND